MHQRFWYTVPFKIGLSRFYVVRTCKRELYIPYVKVHFVRNNNFHVHLVTTEVGSSVFEEWRQTNFRNVRSENISVSFNVTVYCHVNLDIGRWLSFDINFDIYQGVVWTVQTVVTYNTKHGLKKMSRSIV